MILLLICLVLLAFAIIALFKDWTLVYVACAAVLTFCVLGGINATGKLVSTESTIEYLAPVNGFIVNDEGRYVTTGNRFGQLSSIPISGGIPAKFEKDFMLITHKRQFAPNGWAWFNHTEIETKLTSIKPPALK